EGLLRGDEAVLAVDRLELIAQDDRERLLGEVGVCRLRRDPDVRATGEDLRRAAFHAGQRVDERRRGRGRRLACARKPERPVGGRELDRLTLAVRGPRFGVVAVLRSQRCGRHQVLHLGETGDRLVGATLRACTWSTRAIVSSELSCASHPSPSGTAISPPFSQMNGRALYQSWPAN